VHVCTFTRVGTSVCVCSVPDSVYACPTLHSHSHSLIHRVPCVRTRQLVGPAPHLYTKLPRAVAPCAIHTHSRVSAWHTHKHPAPTRLHAIYLSLSLSHSLFRCEYVPHRSLKPVAGTRDVPVANCKKRQRSSSENSRTICSVRQKASKCVRERERERRKPPQPSHIDTRVHVLSRNQTALSHSVCLSMYLHVLLSLSHTHTHSLSVRLCGHGPLPFPPSLCVCLCAHLPEPLDESVIG
jgi:hypothetical protein